ncbi:MAG: quinolinate synthase NadA [Oligosphaeraceae bacterium]|nr:quinolinate synthase NadA [Oligosphaeraceae bacterium]
MDMHEDIAALKRDLRAVILAHNYTLPEIQDLADFVGDSLELSRKAAACRAPVIVFCGVRFMAETAKILSPDSIVLHPNEFSGCPMADMASPEQIRKYKSAHPDTLLVAYVNTTAECKALVDICCTSGNAEKIISSLPAEREIMFLPDANLGRNIAAKLKRPMSFWPGCCPTHNRIQPEQVAQAKAAHPAALVLAHPECPPAVVALADRSLSTGGMLKFAREAAAREFIICTESGIIHRMQKENPAKIFHTLAPEPLCPNMKKITLQDVWSAMRNLAPRIELPDEVIRLARRPIDKMLAVQD